MAQVILNLEFDEILRVFTTGAKNEGFRLLLQKGLNAMLEGSPQNSSEQSAMSAQRSALTAVTACARVS